MVARFSSLFVRVGWQETLLELWDWLRNPATVRVMGLVTGRLPPGPTYIASEKNNKGQRCDVLFKGKTCL